MADQKRQTPPVLPMPSPAAAQALTAKIAAEMEPLPKGGETTVAGLEPLPPRPEDDPNVVGEALAVVRRGTKFLLVSTTITNDTPYRVIQEVRSDSGIVATAAIVNELKRRMMRIGLLRAPRVEDMKNVVVLKE